MSQTSDRLYSCGFADWQSRPSSATGAGGFEVLAIFSIIFTGKPISNKLLILLVFRFFVSLLFIFYYESSAPPPILLGKFY